MAPSSPTTEQLAAALRAALPPQLHARLPALAALLAEVVSGALPADAAGARLAAEPALAELLTALSGTTLEANGLGLRFSGDTITVGDIRDSEALAIGRGAIAIAVQTEEQAYNVAGLPNPYLGLRAFTYADQASFAGREREVAATVARLTAPGAPRPLLFVTGASGSGKSSFAQAGLLPALEAHYRQRHLVARHAVFRPSRFPLAGLIDALQQLHLPADKLAPEALLERPDHLAQFVQQATPPQQVNLVVLDQFEELFTQAEPAQRDALFAILAQLPSSGDLRTHVIATFRSDYLPELFEHEALYEIVKDGVDLRAMSVAELREAIQRPLQQEPVAAGKHFEPALLERLAADAAGDAASLPLLQVTLTDLWNRGSLRLSAYHNLSAAIRDTAEQTYHTTVINGQTQPRPAADQATIMAIMLDLVKVGLGDDPRHDVRRRRSYDELIGDQPERARLIDELVAARLLSRSVEACGGPDDGPPVDVVDIIHETLIANWERLRQAIVERREALQERARFELALDEWQQHERDDAYLLAGVRLAEALAQQNDIALRAEPARELLRRSLDRREAERRQELERVQALAEEQRLRAEEQQRANRGLRRRMLAAITLALIALITASAGGWFGLLARQQQQIAEARLRIAESRRLAAEASNLLTQDESSERALLLAIEAVQIDASPTSLQALQRGVSGRHYYVLSLGHTLGVTSAVFSPDGQRILTASEDGTAGLWPVELADWLADAACRVGRTLTDDEIRGYQVPAPLHFDAAAFAGRQCPPVYRWEQ